MFFVTLLITIAYKLFIDANGTQKNKTNNDILFYILVGITILFGVTSFFDFSK